MQLICPNLMFQTAKLFCLLRKARIRRAIEAFGAKCVNERRPGCKLYVLDIMKSVRTRRNACVSAQD